MIKAIEEKTALGRLKKIYEMFIKSVLLQSEIEQIVCKYKLLALKNENARKKINQLSKQLDIVTYKINALKLQLAKF